MGDDTGAVALGRAARWRRLVLGLTQQQLADRAGLSVGTIANVENGSRVRHLTLPKLDEALGWELGTCARMVRGIEVADPPPAPPARPGRDVLTLERPDGVTDRQWAELSAELVALRMSWVRRWRRT